MGNKSMRSNKEQKKPKANAKVSSSPTVIKTAVTQPELIKKKKKDQ